MFIYSLPTLSIGTGGTIAGTGKFLKDMDDSILVVLSDPEGSGLYNKVPNFVVDWVFALPNYE